jgi:hypothetical protein
MVFGGEAITLGHWLGMALGAVLGIGGFWAARKAIDFAVHVRPYAPLSLRDMTDDEEGEAEHFAEVEYGPVVPCEGTFVPTRGIRTEYTYQVVGTITECGVSTGRLCHPLCTDSICARATGSGPCDRPAMDPSAAHRARSRDEEDLRKLSKDMGEI